ncbi:hypothetical protein ACTFIV_003014 [Dictyostelium citrinum]
MKNLLLFILLITFIIDINCQFDIIIKGSNFTKNSISFVFDINSYYFSKWKFSDIDLLFSCTNNSATRTCVGSVNDTMAKKFKGDISNCISSPNGVSDCNSFLWKDYYPNPIIDGEFRPPTKGGLINLQGFYLVFGINKLTILPSTKVSIGDLESSTIDITNLTLDYKGGCGPRTFIWPNNFNYTFNHQKPNISTVSSSDTKIIANGTNFCNTIDSINIIIDGVKLDKSNITLIDHEVFEISYIQPYCKSISLYIVSGGIESNHVSIDYKPILNAINSVSKKNGGVITITGSRLSPPPSSLSNSTIIVKIGTYDCKNVSFINNQQKLICNIEPNENISDSINLPVKVTINSISNDNKLLFSFDQPSITNILIPQGQIKLIGNFFGTNETAQIFINDVQQSNLKIYVNEKQTMLTFKPNQISKAKINIVVNGLKSNIAEITSPFYTVQYPISPSVNGQIINVTLYNTNPSNYNSIPMITLQDKSTIIGIDLKNSTDNSKHTYSFSIPKGCGRNEFSLSIGNDTNHSEFYYNLPIVNNCSIGINQMIECAGQYQDFIELYKNGKINIIFSNSIIVDNVPNKPIKFTNSLISFPLKPEYGSSEFILEVCNESSVPLKVDISATVDSFQTNPIFNSTGGSILIIGKNFVKETIEKSHLHCLTNNLNYNCTFLNFSTVSCYMNINGPNDQTFKVVYNNKKENITIQFYPPFVLNSTISKSSGLLTITGNEFYKEIDKISIGNNNCSRFTYLNSSCITCFIDQSNLIIDKLLYVNVTINGKNGGKELKIYNNDLIFNNNNSLGGENNNNNKNNLQVSNNKKKSFIQKNGWVIAVIVIGIILVVGLLLNIKYKLYSKTSRILLKNRIKKNFKKNKSSKKSRNGNSINQSNDNILHSSIDSMSSPPLPPPQSRLQPAISPINSIDDFDNPSTYNDQSV